MPHQPTTECPTCRRPVPIPPDDEPMGSYPFCTERCKLIDLGRWMDDSYQIAIVEPDEDTGDGKTPEARPGAPRDQTDGSDDLGDDHDGEADRPRSGPRPNRR